MDANDAPAPLPSEPRRRGRKPSGNAKTSTERNEARRERLRQEGCRMIGGMMLDPVASSALTQLTAAGMTIDEAISAALTAYAAAVRARGAAGGGQSPV